MLPATGSDGALIVAESIRSAIHTLNLQHAGSDSGVVTVSLGVSSVDGDGVRKTATQLIGEADAALYAAKRAGRNRVSMEWLAIAA